MKAQVPLKTYVIFVLNNVPGTLPSTALIFFSAAFQYSSANGPFMTWCQLGLSSFLASDLAFRRKGWTVVTKISVKEPLYPQSLAAKVVNLERGLARRSSMVGGAQYTVFSIESPISF